MKKKTRTRIGSILLCIAMLLSLLPVTAGAEGDEVSYLDENGETATCSAPQRWMKTPSPGLAKRILPAGIWSAAA